MSMKWQKHDAIYFRFEHGTFHTHLGEVSFWRGMDGAVFFDLPDGRRFRIAPEQLLHDLFEHLGELPEEV